MAQPLVGPQFHARRRHAAVTSPLGVPAPIQPPALPVGSVTPSPLSNDTASSYLDASPFKKLGAWGETVSVARDGRLFRAACWLALNRSKGASYDKLWTACQRANPSWFTSFRLVRMDEPSFFLPAGDVVFQVIENPTQIPDRPPRGVLLRHWEAMNAAPHATFYFLRPVFTFDPEFRLYTADDLRREAAGDRDDAVFAARMYGSAIRSAAWVKQRCYDIARLATRLAVRVATFAVRGGAFMAGEPFRLRSRRLPEEFYRLHGRLDIDELIARTRGSALDDEVVEFRRAMRDLRMRLPLDPILCFELPERPGELWFESHWFHGQDGKLYVSY